MAQLSPIVQYLLSRPSFNGPPVVPGFNLVAPFAEAPRSDDAAMKSQLLAGDYPKWMMDYLGGGDPVRGQAILDQVSGLGS